MREGGVEIEIELHKLSFLSSAVPGQRCPGDLGPAGATALLPDNGGLLRKVLPGGGGGRRG